MSGRIFRFMRRAWLLWLLVPTGLLLLAAANIHLVYVAVRSQPDCIAHSKAIDDGYLYRAAKSAC